MVSDTPPEQHARREHMRASDAERDTALRSLAAHFADGRLDRAEFDGRADAALAAQTQDELSALFADLPGPRPVPDIRRHDAAAPVSATTRAVGRPARPAGLPFFPLVPILLALAVIAVLHGAPPFPLIPLLFIVSRRRRRWNREARPWT